jgi:polyisoprenoid-binding protein YceI
MATSEITFFSDAPMEDIKALNTANQGIVDTEAKTFLVKIPIKSFQFDSDLMKDHFNENYMESEKFPFSIYKGTIEGAFDLTKDGQYPISVSGDLTIHGVAQKRTIPAVITVVKGVPTLKSTFHVKLADHHIEIPKLVFEKLAEIVEVKVSATLEKM